MQGCWGMHGCGYLLCVAGRKKAGLGCMHCADSPRISLGQTRPSVQGSQPRAAIHHLSHHPLRQDILHNHSLTNSAHPPTPPLDHDLHNRPHTWKRCSLDHVGLQSIRRAGGRECGDQETGSRGGRFCHRRDANSDEVSAPLSLLGCLLTSTSC